MEKFYNLIKLCIVESDAPYVLRKDFDKLYGTTFSAITAVWRRR